MLVAVSIMDALRAILKIYFFPVPAYIFFTYLEGFLFYLTWVKFLF